MADFSHLNEKNQGTMVDISTKAQTMRQAQARGLVQISEACAQQLTQPMAQEIITTARIAGIHAAKQTAFLIPYCHQILLTKVDIDIDYRQSECQFHITALVKTSSSTGVEMEALAAVQIASLCIFDMIKAVDREAVIGPSYVIEKQGGQSGSWKRCDLV